jgi:DMSO/TMAO reductase YedYZ heme-binding membrane subunit
MLFLIVLLLVVAFALLFRKALIKMPALFYALAVILIIGHVHMIFFGSFTPIWRWLFPALQRCLIALALFAVVMFTGVLPDGSRIREMLLPIRRQLSILGSIFTCGHVAVYSANLLPRLFTGSVFFNPGLSVSLLIALVITLLLIPLTITSFLQIKKRLKPEAWKRIQILAYPFFLLTYAHLMFVLHPTIATGNLNSIFNLSLYTILFGAYLILRIRKHMSERASGRQKTRGTVAV